VAGVVVCRSVLSVRSIISATNLTVAGGCACVSFCVCVCEREREKEKERESVCVKSCCDGDYSRLGLRPTGVLAVSPNDILRFCV